MAPLLDIDGVLKWLAVEKALMNSDGYWVRMSDYNLYQGTDGRFRIFSHDANESLREPEAPPRNGPPSAYVNRDLGVALEPFEGSQDPDKVLLNRLVAAPSLRTKYLGFLRDIAQNGMDWAKVGPVAEQFHALIADDVRADTHKLYSTEGFEGGMLRDNAEKGGHPSGGNIPSLGLKSFFEQRRAYLLNHPDVR